MSKAFVQSSWLYLSIALYVATTILFSVSVGAIQGFWFGAALGIFFFPWSRGNGWAMWTLVVLFALMGLINLIDYIDRLNALGLPTVGCYFMLAYTVYRSKGIPRSAEETIGAHEDILDAAFIATPEVKQQVEQPVEETTHTYPVLVTRIKASFIDGFLVLFVMMITMVAVGESEYRPHIMITLWLLFFFLYEPLLNVYSATVGKRLMKIRVRDNYDPSCRINLWQGYVRAVAKGALGWISVLSILFNTERRAIHDLLASSVVIELEPDSKPAEEGRP